MPGLRAGPAPGAATPRRHWSRRRVIARPARPRGTPTPGWPRKSAAPSTACSAGRSLSSATSGSADIDVCIRETEEARHIMDAKVRDVMTPGPIGVDYDQSVGEAACAMRDWGVGAILVVSNGALSGLVPDRDRVVRAGAEEGGADEPVGPLSSANLIGVDADADV